MVNKIMKLLERTYFFTCFMVLFMLRVHAYIDPSVATYAVQVVAGVAVAVGAVASIYLRKLKKKIQDKLGIDENANKEVEEDIVVYCDCTGPF